MDPRDKANKLVMLFMGLAELVLALRVVFNLFNADATNSFVRWVSSMSEPLLSPFRNIMPEVSFDHAYVLDFRALFAMASIAVVGYIAMGAMAWVTNPRVKSGAWRKWLSDRLS